jgi:RNA polymerase sigma-B factor
METLGEDDQAYEQSEQRIALASGIQHLPSRERAILHLRFFEGLTQSEIAERVGISQMHVSRLIRNSLDRMRRELE